MTPDMTIDEIGDWLVAEGQRIGVADLASRVLRRALAQAEAILRSAIGMLEGRGRLARERDRVIAMLADAAPPPELSAAPVAPARGAMRLIDNFEPGPGLIRQPDGSRIKVLIPRRDGTRRGVRVDRLTMMVRDAWLRHRRDGGNADDFVAPFDPGQIAVGLRYQALVERHQSAGVRCASAETRAVARSGGGSGDFLKAFIDESREIDALHRKIGKGLALQVQRGAGRRDITVRVLVDRVCLQDEDLTTILRDHGWATKGPMRDKLRCALSDALDRMQGYRTKGLDA